MSSVKIHKCWLSPQSLSVTLMQCSLSRFREWIICQIVFHHEWEVSTTHFTKKICPKTQIRNTSLIRMVALGPKSDPNSWAFSSSLTRDLQVSTIRNYYLFPLGFVFQTTPIENYGFWKICSNEIAIVLSNGNGKRHESGELGHKLWFIHSRDIFTDRFLEKSGKKIPRPL